MDCRKAREQEGEAEVTHAPFSPNPTDTSDQKYIDKAHRRGKIGWNVGRQIEVAPHYRRPHMTLVWTGPGRAVPRVVPRRGSVVHRDVIARVPSGFDG